VKRFARPHRPRVVDEVAGQIRWEQGFLSRDDTPERLALLVHWSDTAIVSRSFRTLVREFSDNGYLPVVISACEADGPLDWSGGLVSDAIVLRKPNVGYDFGSWAVGLDALPFAATAEHVVLANDSLVGPFSSLGPLLAQFESASADVWGLTDTRQYSHHLQSYFLGFRGGVLSEKPLQQFWANIRQERSKWDIIRHNELALSSLLRSEGYVTDSAFRSDEIVRSGDNPVISGWWPLLERGFPFVKREIVRDPTVAPRGEWIAREVEAVFGTHLEQWI
jgi:lipopolysaccharide biosynthesis protein